MAKTSYFVPNIHVDGDYLRGSWFAARWFSSKAEDAAAADYEDRVVAMIDKTLWGTWTGCRVLQQIKGRSKKKVEITPYTKDDAKEYGPVNAFAGATDAKDAAPKGINPYTGKPDDPKTKDREDITDYKGTGEGSDVYVHFTPEVLDPTLGPGQAADETLLHELTHGLRSMEGHRNRNLLTGGAAVYENLEEFLAILVTNIYISERYGPNIPLRHGHGMGVALPAALKTSAGFLSDPDNLLWVRWLASKEPDLFASLATVTQASFNPIAEFWNNRTTKYK